MATPLEREFSTIAGISVDELDQLAGQHANITVQFTLDRKIDAAAQDIQAAIARAGGRLPTSMPRPPSYQKVNPAEQPVFYLALDSTTLPMYTVNEYADTLLAQRISMVSGVSRVQVYGAQKYAVRVQVDPDKLAAHGIGIDEVQRRHRRQQHQPAHRTPGWRQAGLHHRIQRHAGQRRRVPPHHRGLAQRHPGAPGAARQRDRQRG